MQTEYKIDRTRSDANVSVLNLFFCFLGELCVLCGKNIILNEPSSLKLISKNKYL